MSNWIDMIDNSKDYSECTGEYDYVIHLVDTYRGDDKEVLFFVDKTSGDPEILDLKYIYRGDVAPRINKSGNWRLTKTKAEKAIEEGRVRLKKSSGNFEELEYLSEENES